MRKLPPYQYKLRFPRWPDWELPPKQRINGYTGGTYIVFFGGLWRSYKNRWKARYDKVHGNCMAITAPTFEELKMKIRKTKDCRYGYKEGM